MISDMKSWVVSDTGDKWTLNLDVTDLSGHLDSTFGTRATTLGYRIDPGYHVVWCRFRMFRRRMTYNSSVHELARVHGLLRVVAAGVPGHGPVHLLLSSASSLGFSWDSDLCVWQRPGLPTLCQLSGPFQFFLGLLVGCLENQGRW